MSIKAGTNHCQWAHQYVTNKKSQTVSGRPRQPRPVAHHAHWRLMPKASA